ncbi:MAG: class I SAM-dependent methyltransferase [Dehalococcoidia bacterium]
MADTTKAIIGRYWAEQSATFDLQSLHTPATDAEWQAWDHIAALLSGDRGNLDVLDVGAGTGFLALLFAERGHHVTGSDLAGEMVDRAREKARQRGLECAFRVEDAEALTLPDAAFDLVVSRHLLWTLPHPEQALAEWIRVARPGGRIAVLDGQWEVPGPGDTWGEKVYDQPVVDALPFYGGASAEGVADLFRRHGLRDVRVEPLTELVAAEHARQLAAGREPHIYVRYAVSGDR